MVVKLVIIEKFKSMQIKVNTKYKCLLNLDRKDNYNNKII
jgi:hypothetical protein